MAGHALIWQFHVRHATYKFFCGHFSGQVPDIYLSPSHRPGNLSSDMDSAFMCNSISSRWSTTQHMMIHSVNICRKETPLKFVFGEITLLQSYYNQQ